MGDVTVLLQAANKDDPAAVNSLYELLYGDLRVLAKSRLRRTQALTSLETTGLVHESYLRFLKAGDIEISDKSHFLAYAARVMRSIVVDLIRNRMRERHGGDANFITLNTNIAESAHQSEDDVIRIHDALEELAAIDARLVQVVEMRYFAGLTEAETANALGVSTRTVERDWEKARMILYGALK
jgi:RNA polymerase sigma factor (TIGR02999 family)